VRDHGLPRAVTDRLMVGGEIYRQTAGAGDARRFTVMNVGALLPYYCTIGRCWARPGRGSSMRGQGLVTFYLALKADY
jgi:hypothetical protein